VSNSSFLWGDFPSFLGAHDKIKLRGEAVTESERLFLDQNLSEAEAKFHKEAPKKGANG